MPGSRSKRWIEKLAIPEKVLSCPLVCLCSLCELVNDNGITFTAVQPISKLSAVTGLTICCWLLLVSALINIKPVFCFSLSHMCVWNVSVVCPVGCRWRCIKYAVTYCSSAGAGMHGPWLMGVCVVLETRTLAFAVKIHPSVSLLGVVSFVISKGCHLSLSWKYMQL